MSVMFAGQGSIAVITGSFVESDGAPWVPHFSNHLRK